MTNDTTGSSSTTSLLLLIPPEIRLHIYSFLLDDGGRKWLRIRNKPAFHRSDAFPLPVSSSPEAAAAAAAAATDDNSTLQNKDQPSSSSSKPPPNGRRRTSSTYHVMERTSMFHRRCYQTTYQLALPASPDPADATNKMHVAILAACRQTHHEAAELLYGRHGFDFGDHVEAVVPFLQDRTPYAAALLRTLSVYKRGPAPCLGAASEKHEWSYLCRFLASSNNIRPSIDNEDGGGGNNTQQGSKRGNTNAVTAIRRLRLVVETGRPSQPWTGVQTLTEADIRLLSLVGGHDVLDWVAELAQVQGLETLEVVPDEKYLPAPKTPAMTLYAALSASIGGGLAPFLRTEMNIPDGG